jgi:hypothetical protein
MSDNIRLLFTNLRKDSTGSTICSSVPVATALSAIGKNYTICNAMYSPSSVAATDHRQLLSISAQ